MTIEDLKKVADEWLAAGHSDMGASLLDLLVRVDAEATERAAKVCDRNEAAFAARADGQNEQVASWYANLASVAGACAQDIRSTLPAPAAPAAPTGEDWKARFDALVREAREIDLGIYPQSVQGKYEKRTEYMDGWNAAIMEHLSRFDEIVERATKDVDEERSFLLSSGQFFVIDGQIMVNLNDTMAWASADAEPVPDEEVAEVARLLRRWGWAGLLYWSSKRRGGERSEFKDVNRFIDFVAREEAWVAREPSSSKRAYTDIPEDLTP